jgi:hypothetical protein
MLAAMGVHKHIGLALASLASLASLVSLVSFASFVISLGCAAPPPPPVAPSSLSPFEQRVASRVRGECAGRYGRSASMDTFCDCLARTIVQNVRARDIVTLAGFHDHVEDVVPSARQVRACMP